MDNLSSKLVLGSAQFGMPYGVSNQNGVPDDRELNKILFTALDYGINTIDSAAAYGDAEERLGRFCNGKFNIVSKFPKYAEGLDINSLIEKSLRILRIDRFYGYMAHHADDLIHFPFLWDALSTAKARGKIERIGYSLYSVQQLEALLMARMFPDIIQVPYNIFDRRFKESLAELKTKQVEVHSRSSFLQGLFFLPPETLKPVLQPLRPNLAKLQDICAAHEKSIPQAALGFVNAEKCIDRIVIGVTTAAELEANIEYLSNGFLENTILSQLEAIDVKESLLLNPANWN